jgi:predicted dienelactone hydrolase
MFSTLAILRCLIVLAALACGLYAALAGADPLAVVDPLPPGPYKVGCSNVAQDFSRVLPGESAQNYWEGYPDGSRERYVTQLLADPADALVVDVTVPDDRELYVNRATQTVEFALLVCYPTTGDNPYPDYALPSGQAVPHMQQGAQPPIFADANVRWPVLLFSHGLVGSPISSDYIDALKVLVSYGYVVVAPFHGDARFSDVKIENLADFLYALLHFRTFVEMQSLRPLSLSRSLDYLFAHPQYRDHVDAARVGGFGASQGGESMLLMTGAKLTITVGMSSKQVLVDPRLRAIVGYVPYLGLPFFPAFGRDQSGLDGIATPFLAIAGSADTTAPLETTLDGVDRLVGSRDAVVLEGVDHHFDYPSAPDIFTWSMTFLAAHVNDDRAARVKIARMTSVRGGGDDRLVIDYTAPALPYLPGESDVVEYHRDATGHYFITANPPEVAALDAAGAWLRTGFEFKAFVLGSGLGTGACRFFSAPVLSPDTHFFTINANECAVVKASPLWLYEGLAFEAQPPLADGSCALDRVPVFRLYNNGMNGQPNHRFLTSKSETAATQGDGWILEGTVFCAAP